MFKIFLVESKRSALLLRLGNYKGRSMRRCCLGILLLLWSAFIGATAAPWFTKEPNHQVKIRVDLFLSTTCPHCTKTDLFFKQLEEKLSWLDVHRYLINQDKSALESFYQRLKQENSDNYSVPAIFFCGSHWLGFDNALHSGHALLRGLTYCFQQVSADNGLTTQTTTLLNQWANANWIRTGIVTNLSPLLFTIVIAFIDAFSPCSLFCILSLFAFLWLNPKHSIKIGMLFLLIIGVMHYCQQVHSITYFQVINWLKIPAIIAGIMLIIYILNSYFAKINYCLIAVLFLVAISAVSLQSYQQTCQINFSLIYEQWLIAQSINTSSLRAYRFIYQLIYLFPQFLFILLIYFIQARGYLKKFKPSMNVAACYILLCIGGFLLFYPIGLSYFSYSLLIFYSSLLVGWLFRKITLRVDYE